MALNQEALQVHSRYIRDVLGPLVAGEGGDVLTTSTLAALDLIFGDLEETVLTLDMLRYSRIEKAMMEICGPGTRWPTGLIKMAERVIEEWEGYLGPLKRVRANLWGPGGRLEGVTKVEGWQQRVRDEEQQQDPELMTRFKERKSSWSVKGGRDPARAYVVGHNGFSVGDWWIKAAAAFRDGMLDDSNDGITADEDGAYAIVMTDQEEIDTGRVGVIIYQAFSTDPGRFRLMKNITSRARVRVLRSWRLKSTWAPKAGLRYDGLYQVEGYGTKLNIEHGKDEWQFTFELRRALNQPYMQRALCHPTADELDDWKDYQRVKAERRGSDVVSLLFGDSEMDQSKSIDSGYFSRSRRGSKE
ncbi:MAG: hypothetical protein M1830_007618 [Pleopsidium flavum]|nr:MAG: hypothetical protein M1830_007618 [Pleopsidium flavum]